MRNADIDTLKRVKEALEICVSQGQELLAEYTALYDRLKEKNDKEKQSYQDKAEYHRSYSRKWKMENPEKQKKYHEDYLDRKKQEKGQS